MFDGTKRKSAPFFIFPLDLLKLLALLGCLALALPIGCMNRAAAVPLTIDAVSKTLNVGQDRAEVFGKAAPGSTVQVYQGATYLGEVVANAEGNWRYALPALAAGAYAISARTTGQQQAVDVTVNDVVVAAATVAPTAMAATMLPASPPVILSPAGGTTIADGAEVTVEGTSNSGNKVIVLEGDKKLGEVESGANGKWKVILPALGVGSHILVAQATGGDGKPVASNSVTVNVVAATVAPTAAPAVATATAEVKAAAVAVATSTSVPAPTATTAAAAAAPTATAVAGKPPVVTGAKVPVTNASTISGKAEPNSKVVVSVDGKAAGEATADNTGVFKAEVPALPVGEHKVIATDANGTSSQATVIVYGPPVITQPGGKKVQPGQSVLKGTAPPKSRVIVIFDGDKEIGRVVADAKGAWEYTIPPEFSVGNHTVKVRAEDESGAFLGESEVKELEVLLILPVTGADLDN